MNTILLWIIIGLCGFMVIWSTVSLVLSLVAHWVTVKARIATQQTLQDVYTIMTAGAPGMHHKLAQDPRGPEYDKNAERELLKNMSPEERAAYKRQKKNVKKIMSKPMHFMVEFPLRIEDITEYDDYMTMDLYSEHYDMHAGILMGKTAKFKVGDTFVARLADTPDIQGYVELNGDIEMAGYMDQKKRGHYLFMDKAPVVTKDGKAHCYSIVAGRPMNFYKYIEQGHKYFLTMAKMTTEEMEDHLIKMEQARQEMNSIAGGPVTDYLPEQYEYPEDEDIND